MPPATIPYLTNAEPQVPSIATIFPKVTVWTPAYSSTRYSWLYGTGSNGYAPHVLGTGWTLAPFHPHMTQASHNMHVRATSELTQTTNQEMQAYIDRE